MQMFEYDPRFDDRQSGGDVDIANPVHAPQAEKKLVARCVGRRAPDHAAVSALRDDGNLLRGAQRDDRGDLLAIGGRQHGRSLSLITAAPIGQPGRHIIRIAAEPFGSEQVSEAGEQVGGGRLGHAGRLVGAPERDRGSTSIHLLFNHGR